MKTKSVLLLVVALGCGLVAMLGVQQALSGKKEETKGESQVLFATAEINPGTRLNETNTAFQPWPAEHIPPGAVTKPEQIEERALMSRAIPGEIILQQKLGEKGQIGASQDIPRGMRLATVSVTLTKTHSGLIMPGDHVDLVLTYQDRDSGRQRPLSRTMTVLENVEVFATDSRRTGDIGESDTPEIKAKNVSLLVTPDQYQLCMLAESKGTLTLALRNAQDDEIAKVRPVDENYLDDLLSGDVGEHVEEEWTFPEPEIEQVETSVEVVEPPKWQIKIFRGDQMEVEEVELPDDQVGSLDLETTGVAPDADKNGKNLKTWLKTLMTGT